MASDGGRRGGMVADSGALGGECRGALAGAERRKRTMKGTVPGDGQTAKIDDLMGDFADFSQNGAINGVK